MIECKCLTYDIDGVEDVASYSPRCLTHGWRWNYSGPALTLEECATRDRLFWSDWEWEE
jgi:hypothetical protein